MTIRTPSQATMAHVLLLPYPNQGHINPMLLFAKRLASRGPRATLVVTRFIASSVPAETGAVALAAISDGFDQGRFPSAPSLEEYLDSLGRVGPRTLAELVEARMRSDRPFTCVVYDTYMPWGRAVAGRFGLPAVAFSTQSCAVSAIYYYVGEGWADVPREAGESAAVAGNPPMERWEFPSFALRDGSYPTLAAFALSQFKLEKDDWVLLNSFEELESKVVACLKGHWRARTIGPCVPSSSDTYGMSLLEVEADACTKWLDARPPRSVVYVSFGSYASLSPEQMEEVASGLEASGKHFLWVVRASERKTLPRRFLEAQPPPPEKGLVVTWAPQLAVLAHPAVGCFVTHCGWNSILEAVSVGTPMVAVGLWTDQPTNAKYVADVWGVGVRAKAAGEKGIFAGREIERCVKEVMEGERGEEIRRNSCRWKLLAKEALDEGGSTDENLNEFVEFVNEQAKK